jgi:hypothetical protein
MCYAAGENKHFKSYKKNAILNSWDLEMEEDENFQPIWMLLKTCFTGIT